MKTIELESWVNFVQNATLSEEMKVHYAAVLADLRMKRDRVDGVILTLEWLKSHGYRILPPEEIHP